MGISRVELAYSLSSIFIWPIKNPTTTEETATTALSKQRPTGIKQLANNRKSHWYPKITISEPYLPCSQKKRPRKTTHPSQTTPQRTQETKQKDPIALILSFVIKIQTETLPSGSQDFLYLLIKKSGELSGKETTTNRPIEKPTSRRNETKKKTKQAITDGGQRKLAGRPEHFEIIFET